MQSLYETILSESREIDEKFVDISPEELSSLEILFTVPSFHPRSTDISAYSLKVQNLSKNFFSKSKLVFVDKGIQELPFLKSALPKENVFFEEAREETFKEWNWLNTFLKQRNIVQRGVNEVVGIGGGLTLNVSAYVAELRKVPLTLVPTTVIGMADGSGGKVRLNMVDKGRFFKHYYKSFYEPDRIIVDPRFLESLSEWHISVGLGEIVKHGIYQSPALLDFLLSKEFEPKKDKESLLKAILWAASLKEVCLRIDVEENANGSRRILRGGHEFSDRIEEDTKFAVPHGYAVAMGIYRDLELARSEALPSVLKFFKKFGIPKNVDEFLVESRA